jgi:hypothetical protein
MIRWIALSLFLVFLLTPGPLQASENSGRPQYSMAVAMPGPVFEKENRACFDRQLLLIDGGLSFDAEIPLQGQNRFLTLGGGFGIGRIIRSDRTVLGEDDVWRRSFPTAVGWRRYLGSPEPLMLWSGGPQAGTYHSFVTLQTGTAAGLGRDEKLDLGPFARIGAGMDIGQGDTLVRLELSLEGRTTIVPAGEQRLGFCPEGCACVDDPLAAAGLRLGLSIGIVGTDMEWPDILIP